MDKSRQEIKNLLTLLDDPDDKIWQQIRSKVVQIGKVALPILHDYWQYASNSILASRIQEIIIEIQYGELLKDWVQWWKNESGTLKEGAALLGQIIDPEFNLSNLENLLKPFINEIWIELSDKLTALEKIRIVNYVFFEKTNLHSINIIDTKSKNLFVSNLLLTGSGHPLAISLLYNLLCRELSIPVYKAGNGENSALVYLNTQNLANPISRKLSDYPTFFYILPDSSGEMLGMRPYTEHLKNQFPTQKPDINPVGDKAFIRIILQKLHNLYVEEKKHIHLFIVKQLLSVSKNS